MSATAELEVNTNAKAPAAPAVQLNISEKAASEVRRIIAEQKAAGVAENLYLRMRVVGGVARVSSTSWTSTRPSMKSSMKCSKFTVLVWSLTSDPCCTSTAWSSTSMTI